MYTGMYRDLFSEALSIHQMLVYHAKENTFREGEQYFMPKPALEYT